MVASANDPVLDAVTVESEVSSDKADTVDVTSFISPVGGALPAVVLDALITRVAVLAARAKATSPAKVPTSEEVVAEKTEAREDTVVRVDVAAPKDTPVAPSPLEEAVALIFPIAIERADVTYALISAVEEVVDSGATSSTPTIPAPTYPYLSSTNAMMVANPP